jgi:uncharacterized protein (DUF2141 family)
LTQHLYAQSADTTYSVSGFITHFKPGKTIYLALYASQEDLDTRNFTKKARFPGDSLPTDTVHYRLTGIPKGYYIVAAFQDLNDDIKLTMGLFGPTEPYGIYEPNYGIFGPKFAKCRFYVNKNITTADIVLK